MNVEELRTARATGKRPEAPFANLRGANLGGANLYGANLGGADLYGADLGGILIVHGIPSGFVVFAPTSQGWHLRVGCWSGTVADLRALIAADDGWPEARGTEVARRRPPLAAVADLCDAHAIAHQADLDIVIAKWGSTDTEVSTRRWTPGSKSRHCRSLPNPPRTRPA